MSKYSYTTNVHHLIINSTDRDRSVYPNAFDFTVRLDNIVRKYKDIVSINLVDTIIPKHLMNNNSNYIYIEIPEFGSNFDSANPYISCCFARFNILTNNSFTSYGSNSLITKQFSQPLGQVSRLTIRFRDDFGKLLKSGRDLYPIDKKLDCMINYYVADQKVKLTSTKHLLEPEQIIYATTQSFISYAKVIEIINDDEAYVETNLSFDDLTKVFTSHYNLEHNETTIESTGLQGIRLDMVRREIVYRSFRLISIDVVSAQNQLFNLTLEDENAIKNDQGIVKDCFVNLQFKYSNANKNEQYTLFIYDVSIPQENQIILTVNLPLNSDDIQTYIDSVTSVEVSTFGKSATPLRSSFMFSIVTKDRTFNT